MIDCFKCLNKNNFDDEYAINSLKNNMRNLLYGLCFQDKYYFQHVEYGKKVYDILESGVAPKFILDMWRNVKNEKTIFGN